MTETKESKKGVAHWIRVVVMFCSFGFVFPHAMTEGEEDRAVKAKTN
jgi:hypothetical protein